MLYAIKKQNESNERLISRFKKVVQRSRIILDAKKNKYHVHKPNKKFIRQSAVMRAKHRARREREQFMS